ncbi:MAG: glycosyltransferase [Clostridia bacterium]
MINLLFTGNDKIFDGLSISLISIVKHCKQPLNVYVLTMDLHELNPNYKPIEQKQIDVLEQYIKKINADSKITLIDVTKLFNDKNKDSANMENSYSPYAFIRLLADEVTEIPDKVLYLDIDIVAGGDISELYNYNVEDYDYGAVKDYYGKIFINRKYINSGVMLLNMKRIRDNKIFAKCRHLVNTKKMMFPDQSALNKFATKKLFLPSKFNSQRRDKDSDVIRHFCKSIRWYPYFGKQDKCCQPMSKWFRLFHTINVKPWNVEGMHNKLKCYKYDDIIEQAINLKQGLEL